MDADTLKKLMQEVAEGSLSPEDAATRLETTESTEAEGGTLLDISVGGGAPTLESGQTPNINAPTRVLAREEGGPRIGRYRILKEHARGGMGRVLLAVDTTIGRKVALKELLGGARAKGSAASGSTRSVGERFLREARVTGRLEHPNIVPVYEIGEGDDGYFYSMRFVAGRTLAQRLKEIEREESQRDRLAGRLQLLDAFYDVCNAVAYAHSKGVIHRDLKPSNIMLGEFGETVVLDWGLARVLDEAEDASIVAPSGPTEAGSSHLTMDGAVIGTPAYMPPEQARGDLDDVNELSDVYALGAVLYEILAGRPPYAGDNPRSIVNKVVAEAPTPIAEIDSTVPPELTVLCAKAMEREMSRRLPSALELAHEVKAFRDGKTLQSYDYSSLELLKRFVRRQWKVVAVIALALVAIGVIGALALNEVVNERNTAQTALDKAEEEEALRIAAEQDAKRRAEDIYASRQAAIKRVEDTLAGYDADMLLGDLYARVDAYSNAGTEYQVDGDEQERNRALITAVLGYASQLQELVRLKVVEGTARNEAAADDTERLSDIQFALVELAVFNTDFELARYLISSSDLSDPEVSTLTQRIQKNEKRLLDWRAARIVACLDDARFGLRGENRDPNAPDLEAYTTELSGFQDDQTIRMLGGELEQLSLRVRGLSRPVGVVEFDMARLLCTTLGNLQKPTSTVPLLSKFLGAQTHPRLVRAAVHALSSTQHEAGTATLAAEAQRRSFLFVEDHRGAFATAYLPPTATPLQRGMLSYARERYAESISALRDEATSDGRLYSSLSHIALQQLDDAASILDELLKAQPDNAPLHIARARVDAAEWDLTHYDLAVETAPEASRILLERARFCRHRHAQQAIRDGASLTERWPDVVDHWQLHADALRDRGFREEALAAYLKAVEVDPDYVEAWLFLGATYRSLDRIPDAYAALEKAVELNPQRSHAVAKLGEIEFFRMNYRRCIELTTRAVAISADEQDAWYYQALAYLRMMENDEISYDVFNARARNPYERANMERAVESFQGLVTNNPRNYRGWAIMSTVLVALGRDVEAQEAIDRAYALTLLDANTGNDGTGYMRDAQAVIEARITTSTSAPETAAQYFDVSLLAAYDAFHSSEPTEQRAFLRKARVALETAEGLVGPAPNRQQLFLSRRSRRQIAAAMRRGGYFHAIDDILRPVVESHPDWIALPDQFARSEALMGLGLQYKSDNPKFLGVSDDDMRRLEAEVDAMTGVKRKEHAEELIDLGMQMLQQVAEDGYNEPNAGSTSVTTPLNDDPRRIRAREVFVINIADQTFQRMNPYSIVVVGGVTQRQQADRLGLKQFDILRRIGDQEIRAMKDAAPAIAEASKKGNYQIVLNRVVLDEEGRPVQARAENGELLTDERGNPVLAFEELTVEVEPGLIGISIEIGYLPHPLDR